MRYYRDGFRPGNPDLKDPAPCRRENGVGYRAMPETVDVLIAGTGPAGLCLAAQLSQFPEISTLIVESSPCNIQKGKADGINTRTMEMFQAFGFADKVKRETYWVNQTSFWMPDPENPDHIKRVGRVQDVADDSSEMPHILINQARLHELFLEVMSNSPSRLTPDYNWSVKNIVVDHAADEYPVSVTLVDTGVNWGQEKVIRANYVVGCDGARSNVRQAIGGKLEGDAANQAWGVMDILANTDFPDIRQKCVVGSAKQGNVLILPREGGYLFRMYVEMDKLQDGQRLDRGSFTADDLIAAASRIIKPYTLDVKQVVWWSIYEIGHRIADRFDDIADGDRSTRTPRVFVAGDACHTHSPKAGQGMNVSMQDTFNLGWKLVHVLTGRAAPDLLHTYAKERLIEAKRLVETDHKWARIMSAPPGKSAIDDGDEPRMIRQFKENLEFTGGNAVVYDPSILTGNGEFQALASGMVVGRRFHSAPVVRLADAKQMQLGHIHEADGKWRIYAFAGKGDSSAPGSAIHKLADWLANDPQSPIVKYTRPNDDIDAIIDVRAVFQQTFDQLAFEEMPEFFKPKLGKLGLMDFEKIFCVDHKGLGDIYDMRSINREQGCMIVVRPDQYTATILPLDATQQLSDFFAGVLI
jgi:phenol 2-monooxygenase